MHDPVASARHSIRGCMNALKLGATALDDAEMSIDEQIEFLDYLAHASDKMIRLMQQWDELPSAELPSESAST